MKMAPCESIVFEQSMLSSIGIAKLLAGGAEAVRQQRVNLCLERFNALGPDPGKGRMGLALCRACGFCNVCCHISFFLSVCRLFQLMK